MEVLAIAITALAHVVGAGVLVWALLDGAHSSWRDIWPRDDDGGGGPPVAMQPPPSPGPYGVALPRDARRDRATAR
jgi:hypothetical protein